MLPAVWVIDDGSMDKSSELARKAGATVLRFERSRGKGAALKAGWRAAWEGGIPWVLSMDGDGQHAPGDISRFLTRAARGDVDLIVGNRMAQPTGMPWLRRSVNQWMSRKLSRAAGFPIPDSQCGFRMMRLEAWSRLELHTDHFEIESEVVLAFLKAGLNVDFVPIEVIYREEESKIHPIRDTWRWFCWFWSGRRT
ncbi:MAG: hypothetical protein JWM16_3553 [Verrucomicrobiales bacterium]|nr:hypothetical protein [Verrucomicrobiales bacterium]